MKLDISKFGPIEKASIEIGDLTVLVGPQASGKSLVLQVLKLLLDKDYIKADLEKYGYNTMSTKILSTYLGEGMGNVWNERTNIYLDGRRIGKRTIGGHAAMPAPAETMFYIPAQRILSMTDGRPKNFMEFDNTNPYVLRHFSESIRLLAQNGLGSSDTVFPIGTRLKNPVIEALNKAIFHNSSVVFENREDIKKMRMRVNGNNIPFMTWSAGQKEFVPLLMGLYCVSGPPNKIVNKDNVQYVVIEEPEMGLHPYAVLAILLQTLLLIEAGKKVIISTHSTVPLEFVWCYNYIKSCNLGNKAELIGELFSVASEDARKLFENLTNIDIKTYYMSREEAGVKSKDITTLDVSSENNELSEWGGLTEFSSVVGNIVSRIVSHEE